MHTPKRTILKVNYLGVYSLSLFIAYRNVHTENVTNPTVKCLGPVISFYLSLFLYITYRNVRTETRKCDSKLTMSRNPSLSLYITYRKVHTENVQIQQ